MTTVTQKPKHKFTKYIFIAHHYTWAMGCPWWHYQMETLSVLLALCKGKPTFTGGFLLQRPITWSLDVLFDLHLNKWLSKQSRCQWFEMPSHSLWCHCNVLWVFGRTLVVLYQNLTFDKSNNILFMALETQCFHVYMLNFFWKMYTYNFS